MSGTLASRTQAQGPTLALAHFATGLQGQGLPADVKGLLGDLFLDYLRVGSLGADMEWSRWARAYLAAMGGRGDALILFETASLDPVRAAFLNATYAGSIDADDTHVGAMLHPGSIVFSSALAIASSRGATGNDFLAAVAAGYEAMIRIGLSIQPTHFRRGFQSTATCGGLGAAVAAARLLLAGRPDAARRIAETIGIAASFAGGLTQFFHSGSTVKRIHAAHAAECGTSAALMAVHGFSGPADILEGKDGFARAYSDSFDLEQITNGLGSDFALRAVTVKGHASSARVQAAVEGVVDLCRANQVQPDDIAELTIGIPSVILGRLTIPRPVDIQAAQMSLPHSVALAGVLASGAGDGFSLTVKDYQDLLQDAAVKALESRVSWAVDPQVEAQTTPESVPAKVTMRLASGRTLSCFVAAPKGSPSRPFTHEDHVARFRREVERRWPAARCDEIVARSRDLASIPDMRSLTRLLT